METHLNAFDSTTRMTSSSRNRGIRAAMIFTALVFLTSPYTLRLPLFAWLIRPLGGAIGLGSYPLQAEFLLLVFLSLAGAFLWSVAGDAGWDEDTLWQLLIVEVRFVLAAGMLLSGIEKVLHVQMPWPTPPDWIRPLREMPSLYYVKVWTGASGLHETMLGLTELAAGVSLLFMRTTMLGALVALVSLGNNVMIAASFDDLRVGSYWPLAELAALALLLVLVDFRRIAAFFAHEDRLTEPTVIGHDWRVASLSRAERWAKPVFLTVLLLFAFPIAVRGYDARHRSPLAGAYKVEEFTLNGQSMLPPEKAGSRWRLVGIDDCRRFAVRTVDDRQIEAAVVGPRVGSLRQHGECAAATSGANGSMKLQHAEVSMLGLVQPGLAGELEYTRAGDVLQLHGTVDGAVIAARLRRIPDSSFNVTHYPNSF
jgi:hypothetical protein